MADMLAAMNVDALLPIGISVGLFVAVFLFVVAVFGQKGEIRMSPQREAAIATGHEDRRTVFEKPLTRPVMWVLLTISHRMAVPKLKRWLQRTLVSAGSPEYYTPEEYLAVSLLTGCVLGGVLVLVYMVLAAGQISLGTWLVGVILGAGLMLAVIYDKASKRLRQIGRQIPYSMDLIALAMGAGGTFTEAVQTVVREKQDDPFNVELKALLAEMELGATRRRALENMADRVPLEQLRSIVSSVVQAEELGTPLADVLHSQANLLRLQRSARAENAAAVASVRILVPSLLILIAVIIAVFAPAILRLLEGGLY